MGYTVHDFRSVGIFRRSICFREKIAAELLDRGRIMVTDKLVDNDGAAVFDNLTAFIFISFVSRDDTVRTCFINHLLNR